MNIRSCQAVLCSWRRWTYRRNKVHFHCLFQGKMLIVHKNGDSHIQNFHLGRYIVGYTFGNHVLRLRLRVAVKLNFRPYIRRYTSPNANFEYSYPLIESKINRYELVYKLKKIVGSNNFSAQYIKIISHYKKIGYNIYVLQQTACLVVNPITVDNFAFLFNCTPVV